MIPESPNLLIVQKVRCTRASGSGGRRLRGQRWRGICRGRAGSLREKFLESAQRVEGHEHDLWDEEEGFGFRLAERTGDFVFKEFRHGPKHGADERADDPDIVQEFGFDSSI